MGLGLRQGWGGRRELWGGDERGCLVDWKVVEKYMELESEEIFLLRWPSGAGLAGNEIVLASCDVVRCKAGRVSV